MNVCDYFQKLFAGLCVAIRRWCIVGDRSHIPDVRKVWLWIWKCCWYKSVNDMTWIRTRTLRTPTFCVDFIPVIDWWDLLATGTKIWLRKSGNHSRSNANVFKWSFCCFSVVVGKVARLGRDIILCYDMWMYWHLPLIEEVNTLERYYDEVCRRSAKLCLFFGVEYMISLFIIISKFYH